MYALDYPALEGRTVTQGHADYCDTKGHGKWTVDGVDQGMCPRCGEATTQASIATYPTPTPVTLARLMVLTVVQAADMLSDQSGSTYTREVGDTVVHYDTATRTLTVTPLEV